MRQRAAWIAAAVVLVAAALPLAAHIATPDGSDAPRLEQARVVSVHDGDTITVRVGGQTEKVRLLGIDSPELNDERRDYRAEGYKARDFARGLLLGKTVTLESDPRQGNRDAYARLLRYVILGDGTNANEELVRRGYARVYNRFNFSLKGRFKDAEREAKRSGLGVWSLPPGPSREVPERR